MSTRSSIAFHQCDRRTFHLFTDELYGHYGIEIELGDAEFFAVLPYEFIVEIAKQLPRMFPNSHEKPLT